LKRIIIYIAALACPFFNLAFPDVLFARDKVGREVPDIPEFINSFSSYLPPPGDTSALKFPFNRKYNFPFSNSGEEYPIYLRDPSNVERIIDYDPSTGYYSFTEKIGNFKYRSPSIMTYDQYRIYDLNKSKQEYWYMKARGEQLEKQSSFIPRINIAGEAFDRVFGSNVINIVPSGSAELIFGFNMSRIDNPTLTEKLRRTPSFTFEEKILMNVSGSIGDKMNLNVNYNTEATFEFENKTKLEYAGKEDEIIKKIEAGDVTLPLTGSLITGSQSLFGIKTEMQFGKLTVTNVFSQQKGETSVINIQGGAQVQEFSISADNYDANRHYFLSGYFRKNYNSALENLPVINSGVTITRIEVWVTNKTSNFEESRNIIAFNDLGEAVPYSPIFTRDISEQGDHPRNEVNNLYSEMTSTYSDARNINNVTSLFQPLQPDFNLARDYEKIENARLLSSREYTVNYQLGYISLNSALNADEVLAVAYEYTYNGRTYRVGELSSSSGVNAPQALYVKLIKGTNFTPASPSWKLMMKNVYAIGAYQVNRDEFTLDILYQDDKTGNAINYIPEGELNKKILLKLLNLDDLNSQNDPYPDGFFDFISGITINESNGRIFFPLLEPFGSDLEKIIRTYLGDDETYINKYVFQELYDSTKTKAQQLAEKNKFKLAGNYQSSSSSEIMLNAMHVPQGSVKITAAGRELAENIDYTVDYTSGRVTIINQGLLESGTPISISLESHSLFDIQTKTLVGAHFDYKVSENFNVGATWMHLTERPLTQKVNIGDEPISNTIWGMNTSYRTESQWLTNVLDKLPFLEAKEPSDITLIGEFANLIPGHSRAISKDGNAYIDDFEGCETSIDLRSFAAWSLSSTPAVLPEAIFNNDLRYGHNRARIAWYVIDPLFLRNNSLTPSHISQNPDMQSSHYVREVFEQDIFPKKENPSGVPTNISILNLAYYPNERGPYNYDWRNVHPDGSLLNPENRWGGIMREIQTNDFETANIEFIEFWLMDPFVEMPGNTGGDLYFNLGNISEDVLKDSRKSFENGLPATAEVTQVDSTVWGRIPIVQSLVNAFNNEVESRQYQDVGLDGLSDSDERSYFNIFIDSIKTVVTNTEAINKIEQDPSSDNFHYYRGSDYDARKVDILTRYKNYNGPDGNSPTAEQSNESYPTTGTTLPNVEDINRDNTLSESEDYYSYRVSLRPQDLEVGRNFIVDKVVDEGKFANGSSYSVNWYQFRIPVTDYEKIVGNISDFKSIRFVRMYLKGFSDSTFLRFATLDLIRGEWRKYNFALSEGGESWTGNEPADGSFDIAAVNIEENGSKAPVNYVLPPGISRVIDPTNPQLRQLNEQSIVLKVRDLEDADARAAYKNVNLDIRQYANIEMEAHLEALPDMILNDYELTAFIRLGSDYKGNFYEYEVPLKITPPGRYNDDNDAHRRIVWPEENRFVIDLSVFQEAKQSRNNEMRIIDSNVDLTTVYYIFDSRGNKVSVAGNPNLSNIRTIMIGVRNPKTSNNSNSDDGLPKSGEVWLNELRLTGFNEKGGWAANGRITTRLSDFGTITFSGNTSTAGFGSIEKKVQERQQEQITQYDLSGNLELGKFFPDKWGVSIPMYAGYSESVINPKYNPLDPDIELKVALANAETQEEKDSIKNLSQDYTQRKSLNFTNVRIIKQQGAPRIYDLANWSTSYSYNEVFNRSISTEYYTQRKYAGALNYTFNSRPKSIEPFRKLKFLKSQYFRIIRDANFNYRPTRLSFRTDITRNYSERKLRNLENPYLEIEPTFNKDFFWNRYFDIQWDITNALKFDFSANNIARIDEPEGIMNRNDDRYEAKKDSILKELMDFGRTINYSHQFNLNYNLPLNKIPLFNWINMSTRYSGTYGWETGPILANPDIDLGNVIKNSSSIQLNGQLNLTNLYNKIPYVKKLNQEQSRNVRNAQGQIPEKEKRIRIVRYTRENLFLRANIARSIYHKLGTEQITVKLTDENGNEVKVKKDIVTENRTIITPEQDVRNAKLEVIGEKNLGENPLVFIAENSVLIMTGLKSINLSYNLGAGTVLPGYKPETKILGMENYGGLTAPGWKFILGLQDPDFAYNSFNKGWITKDTILNQPYQMNQSDRVNIRATFEPYKGFRVDLTSNWSKMKNINEFYVADNSGNLPPPDQRARQLMGNFTMSYLSWRTAFERIYSRKNMDYSSMAFAKFKYEYRQIISERRKDEYFDMYGIILQDTLNPGYYDGYGPVSQEVLIPAFMAAYGYKDPRKVTLSFFPSLLEMMPNWKITFDGLSRINWVRKYFNNITLGHAYRSSYNIGSYVSNPYEDIRTLDNDLNFIPEFGASSVSINEQFSPLFDINMDWKNSLTTLLEFKRSRTLALSTANSQINEINSKEIVFGAGYRFNQVQIIINQKEYKSDLNVRADISIRDNRTVIRKLSEDSDQITAGQRIVTLKTTFDYVLSDRFNLRFFYDQRINKPFVSLSYPTSNTNVGFSVRFTLAQ